MSKGTNSRSSVNSITLEPKIKKQKVLTSAFNMTFDLFASGLLSYSECQLFASDSLEEYCQKCNNNCFLNAQMKDQKGEIDFSNFKEAVRGQYKDLVNKTENEISELRHQAVFGCVKSKCNDRLEFEFTIMLNGSKLKACRLI